MKDYLEVNRESWDKRTKIHVDSEFYSHQDFLAGKSSLKEIELGLMGDVKGLKILHLQCHFGQDSISLARLGAQVTAVDLSPAAIELAQKTAADLGLDVEFICSDVLAADLLKGRKFDMVFASYGTICWLPDLNPWAKLIKDKLNSGGKFMLVDFHPVLDMYDDEMQVLEYSYFNVAPVTGATSGSYAEKSEVQIPYIVWNHPTSEVLSALLDAGLRITHFEEYPYSPYPCFTGSVSIGESRYVIERFGNKMPLCFSLIVEL